MIFENAKDGLGDSAAGMAKRDEEGKPVVYRFNYNNSPKPLQQFIDPEEYVVTKQVTLIYNIHREIVLIT